MDIIDKIQKDYKDALKSKNQSRVDVLRYLLSSVKNKEIEKRPDKLEASDVFDVINKTAKKHKESIEQFKNGNRQDLVEKEENQLKILKEFMPKQLSEEEIKGIVLNAIEKTKACGLKDMGTVMKEVMPLVKGKADGKTVSSIVNESLSNEKI